MKLLQWWKQQRQLKRTREVVAHSRKLLRIHRDQLDTARIDSVEAAIQAATAVVKTRNASASSAAIEDLDRTMEKAFPRPPHASLCENVEVLLVAVLVAMGIRTFFVQPFKIPTGSMQPTLYGIHPYRDDHRVEPPIPYSHGRPSILAQLLGTIFDGRIYEPWGYRTRGDHIFVDKISYHFRRPTRGDVIVFETSDIPAIPESSRGKFYIKRLIGLPGDRIQVQPPYVQVNGMILDGRPAFQRIYSQKNGYRGYLIPDTFPPPRFIRSPADVYEVPCNEYFVLGDNSASSLDGRFWGAFPRKSLVGRAVFVYWPLSGRFGLID